MLFDEISVVFYSSDVVWKPCLRSILEIYQALEQHLLLTILNYNSNTF